MNNMIEGMTILNKSMIMIPNPFFAKLSVSCCFLMCLSIFYISMVKDTDKFKTIRVLEGILLAASLFAIVGMILGFVYLAPSGEYEYTVLIDDSVTANELLLKYDVKKIIGSKYVITDK